MQILSSIAISSLFPEICKEWTALKKDIHDVFRRELSNRQNVVFRDIASKEDSLRNVLREAVLEDVVALFTYVVLTVFGIAQLKHLPLQLNRPYPLFLSRIDS